MDGQIGADAHLGPKVSIHLGSGEKSGLSEWIEVDEVGLVG